MSDRYYDVKVRAPGGEPLTYLIQAPSDLDAKSRAKTEHAAVARVDRDQIEVVSVEETEPGAPIKRPELGDPVTPERIRNALKEAQDG